MAEFGRFFRAMKFSCVIAPSNADNPVGLEIWIDDQNIFDQDQLTESHHVNCTLPDVDGPHQLAFILKNKTQGHTKIDSFGQIVNDSVVSITDTAIDEFELDQTLVYQAVYTHDFNGTGPSTTQLFQQIMGCNGTVNMKFHTPIYDWLVQNYRVD